jgi:hypothetical protein
MSSAENNATTVEESQAQEVINTTDMKDFKFRFRTVKDKDGNESQRPAIEVKLNVPNVQGLIAIIENGVLPDNKYSKELELIFESLSDTIRAAALEKVTSDENITAANFPYNELTWKAIAEQDRTDRRANNIPQELWDAFVKDYNDIMPALTGKKIESITAASQVFRQKFNIVKTRKDILVKLKEQFVIYVNNTKHGERFSEIVDLLTKKLDNYLEADAAEQLIANL